MSESPVFDNENLKKIKWSEKSLPLTSFVSSYPLPQLVQIEEGFHSGTDDTSFSAGQVLKIHTTTTERKVKCYDRHEKELHIPLHTEEKIALRPANYDTVYQRVSDLARVKPLPTYVEVTRGYYNVDSNVDYELSVEPGDKLEVLSDHISLNLTRLQKKLKCMSFRTEEGVEIKIPFDCVAGFKPLVDDKVYTLSNIIPNESNRRTFPFYFEFVTETDCQHKNLGVLKCTQVYDEHLIIASSGTGGEQVVLMIPHNLDVTVKVAVGTLQNDPTYENIRSSFHNFITIENDVQSSRGSQIFRSPSQLFGFTYKPSTMAHYNGWEKFESFPPSKKRSGSKELISEKNFEIKEGEKERCREALMHHSPQVSVHKQQISNQVPVDERRPSNNDESSNDKLVSNNETSQKESATKFSMSDMSVADICKNLRILNMDKYIDIFTENQIDGILLSALEFEDLQELGLKRLEIKKIFSFRDGWKPKLT